MSSYPHILIDEPEDGTIDSSAWVETIVSKERAIELVEEFAVERKLTVIGKAWLNCPELNANPEIDFEEQRWRPCEQTDEGAVEFWLLRAEEIDG